MSTTILSPPLNTKKLFGSGPRKKLHTIHSNHKDIFTIRKNDRTSVLSFSRERDAVTFGKLLETSYEVDKVWPTFDDYYDTWLKKDDRENLTYLTIISWDQEILKSMCLSSDFSMIDVKEIKSNYKLSGTYYQWDVNYDFWRAILEEKIM